MSGSEAVYAFMIRWRLIILKKKDFMDELKASLDGKVSTQVYYDTINYYENYFSSQKAAGKSEEEICQSLGSARLIAKTIIDTNGQGASGQYYDAGGASGTGRTVNNSKKGWHMNVDDEGNTSFAYGRLDFSTTLGKVLLAIAAILVLSLVLSIVAGIIWLGFKIIWYVVIPVVIILFIVNLLIYFIGGGR